MFGEQGFARKTHGHGETFRALPDQHHVPGVFHDSFGHFRDVLDIAHGANRAARRVGPCMQQASSSTTPSSFGKPPRPTLSIVGIVFRTGHDQDRGIQRVPALTEVLVGAVEVRKPLFAHTMMGRFVEPAGVAACGDRFGRSGEFFAFVPFGVKAERQRAQRGGSQEIAAGKTHRRLRGLRG